MDNKEDKILIIRTTAIGKFNLSHEVEITVELEEYDDGDAIFCVECEELSILDCRDNMLDAFDGLEQALYESIVDYMFYDDGSLETDEVKELREQYREIMFRNWTMFYNRRKTALEEQLMKLEEMGRIN